MKSVAFFASIVIFCAYLVLSRCWPSSDSNGDKPADVAELFIQAVNARELALARTYWKGGSLDNIGVISEAEFDAFFEERFVCSSYSFSPPTKQKGGFWCVGFEGVGRSGPIAYALYLRKENGVWRLH
jgi:hypothetical protein